MSFLAHGPSIVTNGLILYYDMYNTKKSFKGAPITNYIPNPYASWNGSSFVLGYNYANLGATYTYVTGVENPINSPGVLQYYTGTSGYKYFSIDSSSLPATGTYTFSYYARLVNGTASGAPIDSQLWRANGSDRSVTGDWNPTFTASWKRYATTGPAEASTVLQYFPVHSGNIIGGYTIQYCGFQLELNSYATTFVSGTRSTTQAIVDVTGRNTLTANVNYSSDGTFSFAGAQNIDINNTALIKGTEPFTIQAEITTNGGNGEILGNYGTGYTSSNLWFATYGLYINGAVPYFPSAPLAAGTYIIAATRDSAGATVLYQNGVSVATGSSSASIPTNINWRIGSDVNGTGEAFSGKIHAVRAYNRALSASEILQNFNARRGIYGL